jgi:hypothetical protein
MKTKTFFILCLLLGISFTQLSAQNGKNGTGTLNIWWVWNDYYIDIPVNCDNVDIDRLVGKVTVHNVNHYQGGESWVWVKQHFNGEISSATTGEVFKIKDICSSDSPDIATGHINLIGNKGSHFIVTYIYDMNSDIFSFVKAVCN